MAQVSWDDICFWKEEAENRQPASDETPVVPDQPKTETSPSDNTSTYNMNIPFKDQSYFFETKYKFSNAPRVDLLTFINIIKYI